VTRAEAEAAGWKIWSVGLEPRWHGDDRTSTWIAEKRGTARRDMAHSLDDLLEMVAGCEEHLASRGLA
jgi:hypothetical protein